MNPDELKKILARPGYGVASQLQSQLKRATPSQIGGKGKVEDLEPTPGHAPLLAEAVSFDYAGKCEVRIRFFRKRLADYSRAISEKAIIDACVYAGFIRDDSEAEIRLIDGGQVKVETDAEERTEVEFIYQDFNFAEPFVKRQRTGNMGDKK